MKQTRQKQGLRKCRAALIALCPAAMLCAMPVRAAGSGCTLQYSSGDDIADIITRQKFKFEGYADLCRVLDDQGLMIVIDAGYGVLAGRSYGTVTVSVMDARYRVRSSRSVTSTTLDEEASTPAAKDAAMQSINNALSRIYREKDEYIRSWRQNWTRLRGQLAAKP